MTLLAQQQDLPLARLSQGLAVLLLSVIYALVLILVLAVSFRAAVERRLAEKP